MPDRIELPDSAPVYGSKHVEVGLEDGNGYVTISPSHGDSFTFSVDADEIAGFCKQRDQSLSLPEPPEGFEETRTGPGEWGAGTLTHTGGGIWCRIWERPVDRDEDEKRIQVMYPVPECLGVTAELHDSEGYHIGTIADEPATAGQDQTDEHCATLATKIMVAIDAGEHDETIAELTS